MPYHTPMTAVKYGQTARSTWLFPTDTGGLETILMAKTPDEQRAYMNERSRAYRARWPERIRERNRANYAKNAEQRREYHRAHYWADPKRSRETVRRSQQRRALADPEAHIRRNRGGHLWQYFRMRLEDFDAMLASQGGVCAACQQPSDQQWHVDHDRKCCPHKHSCGKCVRGILCAHCNLTLGYGEESIERLLALVDYVKRYRHDN